MKMRNILKSGLLGAVAVGAALSVGAGTASAVPDVVDRPYKDAKRMIQRAGGTPIIATRTGAALEEGNCLVTNAWEAGYPRVNRRGRITGNNDVLVALNCNGKLAEPGSPGNSVMTPAGAKAKEEALREARKAEERELAQAATPNQ